MEERKDAEKPFKMDYRLFMVWFLLILSEFFGNFYEESLNLVSFTFLPVLCHIWESENSLFVVFGVFTVKSPQKLISLILGFKAGSSQDSSLTLQKEQENLYRET